MDSNEEKNDSSSTLRTGYLLSLKDNSVMLFASFSEICPSPFLSMTGSVASSSSNASRKYGSLNWIIGLLSGFCATVTSAVLSPQVNVMMPVRISSEAVYPTMILTVLPFSPDFADVVIQSLSVVNFQLSELVTVMVCSPPSASNSISAGSIDIENSFGPCVIWTSAILSPHLNIAVPVRTSVSSFSSTTMFTTAPLSPFFSDADIHDSSDENVHASELVTVTGFSSPAAMNVSSVGSTEIEYSFASCCMFKTVSLSPQTKVKVAVLASVFVYGSTENFTVSPSIPDTSHQSNSPVTSHSSELVTIISCSPPSAPNFSSVGSMLIEYSFFSCVTVRVVSLFPLTNVNIAVLSDFESPFGSAVMTISASPSP